MQRYSNDDCRPVVCTNSLHKEATLMVLDKMRTNLDTGGWPQSSRHRFGQSGGYHRHQRPAPGETQPSTSLYKVVLSPALKTAWPKWMSTNDAAAGTDSTINGSSLNDTNHCCQNYLCGQLTKPLQTYMEICKLIRKICRLFVQMTNRHVVFPKI